MSVTKRKAGEDATKPEKKQKRGEVYAKDHKSGKGPSPQSTESVSKNLNPSTSKESHQKQKVLAKERKAAKPNADTIHRTKQLWEKLRRKSHVPKDERKQMVEELFGIVSGNIHDFVFKHDSVRVVQCALKYAKEEQRVMIAQELKGEYKRLAESRYGKFLVAKLLVSANDQVKDMIIAEFYGHVRNMINHPEASWILDDTYRQVATARQKASLLREWYGPEFAIFKAPASDPKPTSELVKILSDNPEKRKPIMKYLIDLINQLVQKKMTAFTMLHDAMLQYCLSAGSPTTSEAATEFIELLKGDEEGDLLKNLGFTKSGSRVVCRTLALSSAKDRKLILRAYKDNILDLSHDVHGSNILLTAFEVIDDTVMTSKTIISELLASKLGTEHERIDSIFEQATHLTARVPLLYPFATGKTSWLVDPQSESGAQITEVRSLRGETSKKDPDIRRAELAKALTADGFLLTIVEKRVDVLVRSSFGCQFVTEVILGSTDGDRAPAMTAIAKLAVGDPTRDGHIGKSTYAGKMLRTLVSGEKFNAERSKAENGAAEQSKGPAPRLGFAELLYLKIKGNLLQWALSENSFVVANFFDDRDFMEKGDVIKRLRKHIPALQESSGKGNKGASLLLVSMG